MLFALIYAQVKNFLDKNRDTLRGDVVQGLIQSKNEVQCNVHVQCNANVPGNANL